MDFYVGERTWNMENKALNVVISLLPRELVLEIFDYLERMNTNDTEINEIRLRLHGPCSLVVSGGNYLLESKISSEDMRGVFKRTCSGAVFAHRDDICRGFVSLPYGVRVGVCAEAKYERGVIVGADEVSALVFRIPSGGCSFAGELYRRWKALGGGGMLICSAAGEGKTSAIRALAGIIGSGQMPRRVVVADERCEFNPLEYERAQVDVLRGYKRSLGIDIAIRTLSAEILIVDEISSVEDSSAMLAAVGAGVCVIATAHGKSFDDVKRRKYIRDLVTAGLFECVSIISRRNGVFSFSLEKIQPAILHGKGVLCLILAPLV